MPFIICQVPLEKKENKTIKMKKTAIRPKYRALRDSLSENEIEEMSLAVANKILTLPIWEKTYFHIFLPITEQKEVNTECILHLLSGKDKEIIVSKADFSTRNMTHFLLTDNTKIKKNEYKKTSSEMEKASAKANSTKNKTKKINRISAVAR